MQERSRFRPFIAFLAAFAVSMLVGCEPADDAGGRDGAAGEHAEARSENRQQPSPTSRPAESPADNGEKSGGSPREVGVDSKTPADGQEQSAAEGEGIDLDERLSGIRDLQSEGEFAEALRRARLLRVKLKTIEQRQRLKPLLDEMRRMDREANRLEPAIDRLSRGGEMARVSKDLLSEGGRTAQILLREAVEDRREATARPAAGLLAELAPSMAISAILGRAQDADSAEPAASWLAMLRPLVTVMDRETLVALYQGFERSEGKERRAYVEVLDAYAARVHSGDREAFNEALGIAGAFKQLRQFAKRMVESGEPLAARWASGALSAFIVMPRKGLTLWLVRQGRGVATTEDGNVRRWSDASGNGYHAVQPDSDQRPRWVADQSPEALRFDGSNDDLAIRKLTYGEKRTPRVLTVMAWMRTRDTYASIVDFDRSESWSLGINFSRGGKPGQISWNTTGTDNGTHDMFSEATIADGRWHVVFATFDAETGEKQIYIDGELDSKAEAHGGRPLGSGTKRFGFVGDGSEAESFDGESNNSYFAGEIAEVAVWDRVLPAGQIGTLSAARLSEVGDAEPTP